MSSYMKIPLLLIITFVMSAHLSAGYDVQDFEASFPLVDVAWSPDGGLIAIIDNHGTLSLRDRVGNTHFQFEGETPGLIDATAVWNTNGSFLAAGIGRYIYIWERATWRLLHQYNAGIAEFFTSDEWGPGEIREGIRSITWGDNDRYVISGSVAYHTTVWDTQEEETIYHNADYSGGGPGRVWLGLGWLGDGVSKLNIYTNEIVRLDHSESNMTFGGSAFGGTTEVSPDGTKIAWGTDSGYLLIFDLNTLYGIQGIDITMDIPPAWRRALADIAWNQNGSFIAAVSRDGEVFIANLISGEVASVIKTSTPLKTVDWDPTTNNIVFGGSDSSGQMFFQNVSVSGIARIPFEDAGGKLN